MNNLLNIKILFRKAPWSFSIILIWLFFATFASLIANENGLIPYSATSIDFKNAGAIGPFEEQSIADLKHRHWLGTDELGRDVLSQLIHASQTALIVGLLSVLLSALIGISLGISAAYLGDRSVKVNRGTFLFSFSLMLLGVSYLLWVTPWQFLNLGESIGLALIVFFMITLLIYLIGKIKLKQNAFLPVDLILGRTIEAMDSLPILFIIISLSVIVRPSIMGVVLIIGISNWATLARYARGESLKVRSENYIEAARAIGLTRRRILFNHILPNALPPLIITMAFGVAASILIESTLSFLGVGIGVEEASWGSMLAEARRIPQAWWLSVFPGLAIFAVIFSCNQLGELLSKTSD